MTRLAPPKGGKKGGKQFPRVSLKEAVGYAKKLVSRTFTAAQPRAIIFKGVFNSAGTRGEERASAMRQYGFLDGTNEALTASQAARDLVVAIGDSQKSLLQQACLKPKVFNLLYSTFQGDKASAAQLRQQAVQNGVHPDTSDRCVELFIESALFAGLAAADGDQYQILSAITRTVDPDDGAPNADAPDADIAELDTSVQQPDLPERGAAATVPPVSGTTPLSAATPQPSPQQPPNGVPPARSVIQINVNLDSSFETEKLEKQLELLRRYGAL